MDSEAVARLQNKTLRTTSSAVAALATRGTSASFAIGELAGKLGSCPCSCCLPASENHPKRQKATGYKLKGPGSHHNQGVPQESQTSCLLASRSHRSREVRPLCHVPLPNPTWMHLTDETNSRPELVLPRKLGNLVFNCLVYTHGGVGVDIAC